MGMRMKQTVQCVMHLSYSKAKLKVLAHALCLSTKSLKNTLDQYKAHLINSGPSMPLFTSQKGGHISANTMCQLFLNVFSDCGLKGASSHTPRRTFITRLANKGIGVRVLAELAGHSSIAVTQRYIDVNDTQLAQAVELVKFNA